jgi:hypothetical protein
MNGGNPAGWGAASPPLRPTGGLEAWAGEGPLHFMARGLQVRLQQVFPASGFDWHWLDGKISKAQWVKLTQRTPSVCVGFGGVGPSTANGETFMGRAHWFVSLVTRNPGSPQARLLGDRAAPGILALVRAATLALHGFRIDPPDTPWAASGAVEITDISALTSEDWIDEALAAVGISLSVPYEEALPPGLDTPNHFNALRTAWSFSPNGAWTDTFMEAS